MCSAYYLYLSSMFLTYVQFVLRMCSACSQHMVNIFFACAQHIFRIFIAHIQYVYCISSECSQHMLSMFIEYSQHAHEIYSACVWHILSMHQQFQSPLQISSLLQQSRTEQHVQPCLHKNVLIVIMLLRGAETIQKSYLQSQSYHIEEVGLF